MTRHVKQVNLPQNVPAHVIYLKDLLCPASRSQTNKICSLFLFVLDYVHGVFAPIP